MGACVSSPESCVGGKIKYPKHKFGRRRRRKLRRRAPSIFSDVQSLEKVDRAGRAGPPSGRTLTNPTFRGLFLSLPFYLFASFYGHVLAISFFAFCLWCELGIWMGSTASLPMSWSSNMVVRGWV